MPPDSGQFNHIVKANEDAIDGLSMVAQAFRALRQKGRG